MATEQARCQEQLPGNLPSSKVVVAGGYNNESRELNSVEMFDPSKGTWTYLQPMKEGFQGASAFLYNNQIVVSGGYIKSSPGIVKRTDSMEALSNANQVSSLSTWKHFPAKLPENMSSFGAVVYNDSLIVVGGTDEAHDRDYSNDISEVSLVHPYAIKMLTKMPRNISGHAVELFSDKIVIVGGLTIKLLESLSNVLMYDIKNNECVELAPLPYPVYDMATVRWTDNVVVIGGENNDCEKLNTVIIYNVKTQKSHLLPPMIHKRSKCTAVVVDNTIIVIGGKDESSDDILKSVERFSFTSYTWKELPSMHVPRCGSTSVAC